MSRTKLRATQESSDEVYRRFHFLPGVLLTVLKHSNIFVVFKKRAEGTAKTYSPEQHSAFRESQLKFVKASNNSKEKSSSQKLATSEAFRFLTSF